MKTSSHKTSRKAFRGPGVWETIREHLLGVRRPMDCIQVEVTSRCPGQCSYCPHTTMRARWRSCDMEMDTFTALWPLMRRTARVHLQGWGEPLLSSNFFDMVALARRAGCAVSTTTCGLLMDEDMARKLVGGGLDIVAFSLAGTDAATNVSRRGIDFERVLKAVSILQAVRRARMGVHLEIHFAYLMLASQMEAVRGLPELMHELGVHAAVVSTLDYIAAPGLETESFSPQETEKLSRAEKILRETASEARRMEKGFHYVLPRPDAPGTRCRENIFRSVCVTAEGFLAPCVYVNLPVNGLDTQHCAFGNVRESDPLAILESEPFRRFRQRLAGGDPDLSCRSCPKRFEA